MGWKKRDFVEQALEEIGYAGYIFDAMPEQVDSVLRALDAMMASWNARGIRVGYPLPNGPLNSRLEQETTVPDACNEAIYLMLACRVAARFGKVVQQETKQAAKDAFGCLLMSVADPREMQLANSVPAGAGNRWNRRDFLLGPFDNLKAGLDNEIEAI
jgi:P22 tail accessory factor